MKKIIKKTILTILLVVWILSISAADSMLDGWWFVLGMLLCIVPLSIIAWLCNKGWLDDILDKDVEE